jgi:hypothetical protein
MISFILINSYDDISFGFGYKKRGLLTSSTFYQVSANTSAAYSSKSPRRSVSTLTFTLAAL